MENLEETFEEEKEPHKLTFPNQISQFLIINSPKLPFQIQKHNFPAKNPLIKPKKPFKKPKNLQIFPLKNNKNSTFEAKSKENLQEPLRKPWKNITMFINPFLKGFSNEKPRIRTALLRNNEELKEYYKEKLQLASPAFHIRDKKYRNTTIKNVPPKFSSFWSIVLGILRIMAFIRKRRALKFISNFTLLLEGKDLEFPSDSNMGIPLDLESMHATLIKRNPYSDPFFIEIIEKFTYKTLILEFRNSSENILVFLSKFLSFLCKSIVTSNWYNLLTLSIIIVDSYSLYQDFRALETFLPKSQCLNLTNYPPNMNSPYHYVNLFAIYYFLLEFLMKISAFGLISYIKDLWNLIDLAILYFNFHFIYIDLVIFFQPTPFRILRFVKLLNIKALQHMVTSLEKSLILLSETFFILVFFSSIFAIIGMQLFSELLKNRCFDPFSGFSSEKICGNSNCDTGFQCWKSLNNLEFGALGFDNFVGAFIAVLRIMTLSCWSTVMYAIQRSYSIYSWVYFIVLIICGNFFLINLTLAVLKVKFSENLEKIQKNKTFVKKFGFKQLLDKKIIRSSREIKGFLRGMNRRDTEIFWRNKGNNARVGPLETVLYKRKSKEITEENMDLMRKKRNNDNFKKVVKFLHNFFTEKKNVISEEIKKNQLEIIVNYEQEYCSLSTNDVLIDQENKELQEELIRNQGLLHKKRLSFEYSLEQIKKHSFSEKKKPRISFDFPERKKSSIFSKKLSFFSKITENLNKNQNSFDIPSKSIDKKHENLKKYVSPLKSPKKSIMELKLIMDKKILRNKQQIAEISKDYRSIQKVINEEFEEIEDLDSINCLKIYVKILENDIKKQKISKFHWSGLSVLPSKISSFSYWNSIFSELSLKNNEIWIKGLKGKLKFLKKTSEMIIFSSIFLKISTIFTILTLIELSIAESIDNEKASLFFSVITHFFLIEFLLKIQVFGFKRFSAEILNKIELIILIYSLILVYFSESISKIEENSFKSLRLFKILIVFRVLRILSHMEFMKFILLVLSTTFNYFIYIAFFLILLVLTFSLISKQIYSQGCDFSVLLSQEKSFSSIYSAMFTIFNMVTLDNWSTMITASYKFSIEIPLLFIIVFLIFFGNFIILNLFIAIMLDSFEVVKKKLDEEKKEKNKKKDLYKTNKELYLEMKKSQRKPESVNLSRQMLEDEENSLISAIFSEKKEENSPLTPYGVLSIYTQNISEVINYKGISCKNSLFLFSQQNSIRKFCNNLINNHFFELSIYFLIIAVSVIIGLQTFYVESSLGLEMANLLINFGFVIESLMKIISSGLFIDKGSYLRDYKNMLDLTTIILSFLGLFMQKSSALKGLLLLRLWRPISLIYKRKYIKDLINALISSLYEIFNVFVVVLLVWFVFSLIGIQLFHDRFGFCGFRSNFNVSFEACEQLNMEWEVYYLNFNDIYSAFITIFALSTLDNWANLLNISVNSDVSERGPSRNNNQFSSYWFFLAFVIVAVWLFFNLFIGVIFNNFMEISRKNIHPFLSESQIKWLEIQRLMIDINSRVLIAPKKGMRGYGYIFMKSKGFERFLIVILSLNFVILALFNENTRKSVYFQYILSFICFFFLIEAAIMLFVYRLDYFRMNRWNTYNLFVAIAFLFDLIIEYPLENIVISYAGSTIFRIFRLLKVFSLIRIIEKLTSLKALILNLLLSWRLILNMILLLFIILFIYAVIGVYMFREVFEGEIVGEFNNFHNLFYAIMALFKCVTREEWYNLMFDLNKVSPNCEENRNCGSVFSPFYFISFMILNTYIVFNLFILILVQQFEEFHKNSFNPMDTFKKHLEYFKTVWNRCCMIIEGGNEGVIHINKVIGFYKELGLPLGFLWDLLVFYGFLKDWRKMRI